MSEIVEKINRHAVSRPVNIEAAIRDVGIKLRKNVDLPDRISGHIRRIDGDRFEIASASADHYFRQRFTMAHELGHYVMHRRLIGEGVDDNVKYRSTADGEFYNTEIEELHEQQANAFAATLLLPERLVREYLEQHAGASLREVATAFQVSPSCMRWRLRNLDLYEPRFHDQ